MNPRYYLQLAVAMFVRSVGVSTVSVAVTDRCNSRCETCAVWRRGGRTDLDPRLLGRLLDAKALAAPLRFDLTGGEPFLHPDLPRLVELLFDDPRTAFVGMTTNGLCADRTLALVRRIAARGGQAALARLGIGVSLDGQAATHDAIRGVPGSHARSVRLLAELRAQGIRPQVSLTIQGRNADEVPDLVAALEAQGIEVAFRLAQREAVLFEGEPAIPALSSRQMSRLRVWLSAYAATHRPGGRFIHRLLSPQRVFVEKMAIALTRDRWYRCFSGLHSLFVTADGTIYPCTILNAPLGNLRAADLDAVMRSPRARRVLHHIAARRCRCWTNCETIPSLGRLPTLPWLNLCAELRELLRPGMPSHQAPR